MNIGFGLHASQTIAVVAGLMALQACSADPLEGRWQLNTARSHYGGAAPRLRETFECGRAGQDVRCTISSSFVDGRSTVGGFSAAYGGPPGATFGMPDVDHILLVKVSDATADATFTNGGRPVFGYRASRSDDGKVLTISAVDPVTRVRLESVIVYDRDK